MSEQKWKRSSLVYLLIAAKAVGGGGHLSSLVLNTNKQNEKGLMSGSPCHGQLSTQTQWLGKPSANLTNDRASDRKCSREVDELEAQRGEKQKGDIILASKTRLNRTEMRKGDKESA